MKKIKSLGKQPPLVLFVKGMAMIGQPISYKTWEEVMTKYPEYFPEEVERKRKWDAIPASVHKEYWDQPEAQLFPDSQEIKKYEAIIGPRPFPDLPGGIIHRVTHEEYNEQYQKQDEWDREMEKLRSIKRKELRDKLYKPYGIIDDE